MQSVDAQGNVITQGREGDKRNSLKGYPPLYSQDEQDSSLLILRSGDEGITLAPPTRKEQRKRERQARKGEKERRKTEARLLRGEAAMLAQLPTNMAVYAIPLIQGQDPLFLTPNKVPPDRFRSKVMTKLQEKQTTMEREGERGRGVSGWAVRWAVRQLEGIPPSTRLLSNTPENISQLTLVHPECISSQKMYDDLTTMTMRLVIYSVALPFIAAAEGLAPVWPNIITVVDAMFIWFHYKAYKGAKRLMLFEANSKEHIECCSTPYLDKWMTILAKQKDGVLNEQQITNMCYDIGEPDMIDMLNELRRDYLRKINRHDLLLPCQR